MKKVSLIIIALISISSGIFAQTVDEALRYSQIFYGGTARFMSMGGAFTALGGDISTLSQNPAGLGVYRSSEFTITPQLMRISSTAGFNNTNTTDFLYNYNLNQVGLVSNLISNSNETGLIVLNLGYSFNKTNNLNQSIRIQGSGNSSIADYWAGKSNGILKDDLIDVQDLAYQTWLIDPTTGTGGLQYGTVYSNYGDNPPSVYGQSVKRIVSNSGYTGEHALSIGGNYSNKIFFGATLGISKIKYTGHFAHTESTDQALLSEFKNFTFTDHFEDNGTGYSLKLGAVIKPVEILRIGLAFHSPTFYRIDETYYSSIRSSFTNGGNHDWKTETMRYNYALQTPFRALAGIALQVKKFALLSADYEFVDYSTARFDHTAVYEDYTTDNEKIKDILQPVSNIRLGGEFRLNKLYLRTGYGYYGKAFKPGDDNSTLDYSSLSFGAGYREKNISLDFAFTSYKSSQSNLLYPLDNTFAPVRVNESSIRNMFTLTVGYKFGY